MLPLTLAGKRSESVLGLLDTGAAVNVVPYTVGTWRRFRTCSSLAARSISALANGPTGWDPHRDSKRYPR
jgi:hypothetical protein